MEVDERNNRVIWGSEGEPPEHGDFYNFLQEKQATHF